MSSQLIENPLVFVYRRAKQRQKLQLQSQYKNSIKNINLNDQIKFRARIKESRRSQNSKFGILREDIFNYITLSPDKSLKKYRTRKNTSSIQSYYNTLIIKTNRNTEVQSRVSNRYKNYQQNNKASEITKVQKRLLQPCQISTIVLEERPFTKKNFLFPRKTQSSLRKTFERNIHTVDFRLRVKKPQPILQSKSRQIIEPWKYQNEQQINN